MFIDARTDLKLQAAMSLRIRFLVTLLAVISLNAYAHAHNPEKQNLSALSNDLHSLFVSVSHRLLETNLQHDV